MEERSYDGGRRTLLYSGQARVTFCGLFLINAVDSKVARKILHSATLTTRNGSGNKTIDTVSVVTLLKNSGLNSPQ